MIRVELYITLYFYFKYFNYAQFLSSVSIRFQTAYTKTFNNKPCKAIPHTRHSDSSCDFSAQARIRSGKVVRPYSLLKFSRDVVSGKQTAEANPQCCSTHSSSPWWARMSSSSLRTTSASVGLCIQLIST